MAWSAVIAAALGALGSLGSAGVSAGMTRRQMKYARKLANQGLTNDQLQAFELSRQEAQAERDWNLEMDNTRYQRTVADMQAAGVNPALAMTGSIGTAATSNNAPSVSGSGPQSVSPVPVDFSSVAALASVGLQKKRLDMEYKLESRNLDIKDKEADAALLNAESNSRNASTNEGNLEVNRQKVTLESARVDIEKSLAESHISVNEATINKLSADVAHINKVVSQMDDYLSIARKNSDSQALQASAALTSAKAALQNAVTNSYVADYQTDLYYTNSVLNDVLRDEKKTYLQYLPQELQYKVENMMKEGVLLDKRGDWLDKNGKLMDSQRVRNYVETGVEVTKALTDVVSSVSPIPKIGFK